MIVRAHAAHLPLRDATVDLVVTSPPYFALRSYRDDGEHYAGQVGSEDTPGAFVDALLDATAEMIRVLKPTGSIFVNLGDKYAGSGGHNNANITARNLPGQSTKAANRAAYLPATRRNATRRNAPDRYNQNSDGTRAKSLMGLPWRYAIGCIDQLGLILRAEIIWSKPNGLPESVNDRVRRSHEQWFHFTKQGRYFSAVDEVREPDTMKPQRRLTPRGGAREDTLRTITPHRLPGYALRDEPAIDGHPLGKLPGSVWTIPSEPLTIPDWARAKYGLPDHFAAFPQEWPRRFILGWSPSGICTRCGEGRRPVADVERWNGSNQAKAGHQPADLEWANDQVRGDHDIRLGPSTSRVIIGYACACSDTSAATRPAVVLDPFGGTGTVAMVARTLGRYGVNGDLSGDYCRLARWRIYESGHAAKSEDRTWRDAQGSML